MQLQLRVEGFLGVAIGDKLEALKQASPAHIADEGVIAEPLLQPARKIGALDANILKEIIAAHHPLHGQGRGAGERMTHIGVAMLECA
jgi:hypothetical protein